ncbi:TniB family NTP-binding protein [Streptomyces albidoflavus]
MTKDDEHTAATLARLITGGPPPVRETLSGWEQWRTARAEFTPAPQMDLATWRVLSPRERLLHDLHRAATHSNLPVLQTPMTRKVARRLTARLKTNWLKQKPTTRAGIMITGGGAQGKTETVCEIIATFQDDWERLGRLMAPGMPGTRDVTAPVAYVQTPVTAKPKSTCKAILSFYDAPVASRMDLPDLVRQVAASLHDHGTRVLVLDDITRLRMHRADDQDTLDLIRAFMSMHVTLVLIGVDIPSSGLLREGRFDTQRGQVAFPAPKSAKVFGLESTQTERRFDLVELDRFHYGTPVQISAWAEHLSGVEHCLRLLKAPTGMLTGGAMPEYLYRRTNGVVGLLERLIEDGCEEAIDTGTECLTETLLDGIDIDITDDPHRDHQAGEVPRVPERETAGQHRRARNSSFDDRGPAAADTGS